MSLSLEYQNIYKSTISRPNYEICFIFRIRKVDSQKTYA